MLAGPGDRSDAAPAGVAWAWELTRLLSPRPVVRVAAGAGANEYPGQAPVAGSAPAGPWAMYLTDARRRYRYLGLDFDAHGGGAAEAASDAETIAAALEQAGIAHVVCESGPSGGRHVWVGLAEPAGPGLVRHLAHSLKLVAPSLDVTPLLNPATGCLRPPGAPHRNGGASRVIAGDLTILTRPTTTPGQLTELASRLNGHTRGTEPADEPYQRPTGPAQLPVDEEGRPWLPGPRRPLPAKSRTALDNPIEPAADASYVLYIICLGAAAAHWHWRDLVSLVDTAPGMEHARTQRITDRTRCRRPTYGQQAPEAALGRVWQAACQWVATHERRTGDDPTFDGRAETIAALIEQIQSRADASPGRWTRGGGPADRRVLDALCLWTLQAVRPDIEADTRRLALASGLGRETARTALHRLADDGWITQTSPAAGRHAPTWTIDPQNNIHSAVSTTRAQGASRPAGAGATWRRLLIDRLTQRQDHAAHDVFTGHPHRIAAGNLYARLNDPETTVEVFLPDAERLLQAGLITRTVDGWRRSGRRVLDRAARALGVEGVLDTRRRRYALERQLWDWWCTEHEWMTALGRHRRRRQPLAQAAFQFGQSWDRWPPYPRRPDRRADHRRAAALIRTGELEPAA